MSNSEKGVLYGTDEAADKQKALRASGNMDAGFQEMADKVYAHLTDEISKKIFEARLKYAAEKDLGYITGLESKYRNLNSDMQVYVEKIQKGAHVMIYGAGVAGHYLFGRFKGFGVNVDCFIDQDESKGPVDGQTGIKVITEKDLIDNKELYGGKTVVISYPVKPVAHEVRKRLIDEIGIDEKNIIMGIFDWRNNQGQYFDYFAPGENEVFVDCGCFDGATCFNFAGWCGSKGFEHIYSFEADPKNYEKSKELLAPLGKCELFPYGTSDANKKVYFASDAFETSCIISREEAEKKNFEGVTEIETVALDDVLAGKRVTFIKMDIEGAEYEALMGARKLIMENRPRMAISVYHKFEDFVTLADLVLSMHPDYQIAYRHYGFDDLETVMYVE
ncbi:FkbM family methyltransferase [Ruminococcaceae bacterium R-25]|nr:FkbM family methyltransferase [Ruminococcaceae bacterium R-25]SUQ21690.1 methyltransferase, FkbM family [Oscillospiraceae bacterium]